MKADKQYFREFHIAGRQYHDANEVWDLLKVGTLLKLVRDESNRFDPNAVALVLNVLDKEMLETRDYVLGYVPRDENEDIAAFLDMGWGEIFECRISKINEDAHYENQLRVCVKILRKPKPEE